VTTFPEPASTDDLRELLLRYLDYYRAVVSAKVGGFSPDELRTSRLASGWTPAGLINHLAFMERRWLQWGFAAQQVDDPWGDSEGSGWHTPSDGLDALLGRLTEAGVRTREIVSSHELTDLASTGGRFATHAEAPQLHWILLHVLQEYARHAGHLDIVRELSDGATGEVG